MNVLFVYFLLLLPDSSRVELINFIIFIGICTALLCSHKIATAFRYEASEDLGSNWDGMEWNLKNTIDG